MPKPTDILITGLGVVSPIGVGVDEYWKSLAAGRSGISWRDGFENDPSPVSVGGVIRDFDGRQHIKPRKAIKVMCQEIQFGHAAATMAVENAGIILEAVDLERFSVIYGGETFQADPVEVASAIGACTHNGKFEFAEWGERSMREIQPLWMLKYLPNMVASHISIALGATGPNNTICQDEVSSALATIEAASVMERGWADIAIAGGTGSWVQMNCQAGRGYQRLSHGFSGPDSASRPFHPDRNGYVCGEGAGAIVLETRSSAESRNATVAGRLAGWSRGFCTRPTEESAMTDSIVRVASEAMKRAGVSASELSHINANGSGGVFEDKCEAAAIRNLARDANVVAVKTWTGNTGSGTSTVELIASVLALQNKAVPPGFVSGDLCNWNGQLPRPLVTDERNAALKISFCPSGQVVALVVTRACTTTMSPVELSRNSSMSK